MLTRSDDFPVHQTAEPIAYSGTDPNFYDRYFFNGYAPDASGFFAVAFGVYPHLGVMDAHFSVIRDGTQHCVHASRPLIFERADLRVGPIAIEVTEPLQRLTVRVDQFEGISAELRFEGRAFPIQEPRFTSRRNARMFMDYTRFTQNGRYSGFIEVDGVRDELAPGTVGTRDRSWGVRPVGAPDSRPEVPPIEPQFYWIWTPVNFPTRSAYFHVNADAQGLPWNTRAVIVPDGATAEEFVDISDPQFELKLKSGTRHAGYGRFSAAVADTELSMDFEPLYHFQMRGIGYGHERWGHGVSQGMELAVERECIDLAAIDESAPQNVHIEAISKVTLTDRRTGSVEHGVGVFEQLIAGPYEPLGLTGMWDPAP
jgi:hypothetical protein